MILLINGEPYLFSHSQKKHKFPHINMARCRIHKGANIILSANTHAILIMRHKNLVM